MMMSSCTPKNEKGQIVLVALVLLGIFLVTFTSLTRYVGLFALTERRAIASTQALQLAEAGMDQAVYQLNQDSSYTGETGTPLGNGTFTVIVTNIDSSTKRIIATGYIPNAANPSAYRTVKATVSVNPNVISFNYGIQSGNGGFVLQNSSSVTGNVFSSGSITGSGNTINGDVISAGLGGLVYGVHATGSVYAHMIGNASQNTTVDKNAYYMTTITNTNVSGLNCPNAHCFPNSTDQPVVALPISDAQISQWENDAAGTVTGCTGIYEIKNTTASLGTQKITCDLDIKGSTVTLTGPVWVTGNITIETGSIIKMSPDLGSDNVAFMADNPANRLSSSKIALQNGAIFQGSGAHGSYVFMISQNNSAETGGSTNAISMGQGASALVGYASHGQITLSQSTNVKEITAYKIVLTNTASVTYDTGLPNTLFESGPGGSWVVTPGTYSIVR